MSPDKIDLTEDEELEEFKETATPDELARLTRNEERIWKSRLEQLEQDLSETRKNVSQLIKLVQRQQEQIKHLVAQLEVIEEEKIPALEELSKSIQLMAEAPRKEPELTEESQPRPEKKVTRRYRLF